VVRFDALKWDTRAERVLADAIGLFGSQGNTCGNLVATAESRSARMTQGAVVTCSAKDLPFLETQRNDYCRDELSRYRRQAG